MKELIVPLDKKDVLGALVELSTENPNTYFSAITISCHILKKNRLGEEVTQREAVTLNGFVSTTLANLFREVEGGVLRSEEKLVPVIPDDYKHLRFVRTGWGYRFSQKAKAVLKASGSTSNGIKRPTRSKRSSNDVVDILDMVKDLPMEDLCRINVGIAEMLEKRFANVEARLESARRLAEELGSV